MRGRVESSHRFGSLQCCCGHQRGFTLLELIMVLVIAGTLAGVSVSFMMDTAQVYSNSAKQLELMEQGRQAIRMIAKEVRVANDISFPSYPLPGNPPNNSDSIRFDRPAGELWWVNQGKFPTNLTYAYDVPEKRVTRVSDHQIEVPLVDNVTDFSISRDSYNLITISITLDNGSGRPLTLITSAQPRGFN